jgi:hypothetical protein
MSEQPRSTPSIEELRETYKLRFDLITHKTLTVENIDTFADEALEELVTLTNDVLESYRSNPNFEPNKPEPLFSDREQEDDAFNKLGLTDIQNTLQGVMDVKEKIDNIKSRLTRNKNTTNQTIVPPSDGSFIKSGSGEGIQEKSLVPRLLTLLYLLEKDFEILEEGVTLTEGQVTPDMMRRTPYVRVEIPDMDRVVYICDEEGNASYVFDTDKLKEFGIPVQDIDISDKEKINEMIAQHPGVGARIIQSKSWRVNMANLLSEDLPNKIEDMETTQTENSTGEPSEFKLEDKKEFLSFEDFQKEVNDLYPGSDNINIWYREERIKHKDWPSNPNRTYRNKGWIGFPELVGEENMLKKEFLSFEDFQKEVNDLYPGSGGVRVWYVPERIKHKGWPSNPDKTYRNKGWIGFPELVGFKKEFLSFEDFQKEVRDLYPGSGGVREWYVHERIKHKDWPSDPKLTYKNKGWIGFSELVGIENRLKIEYLSFDDFRTEVISKYPGKIGIQSWYRKEKPNHQNWPSSPYKFYINKGWIGWPELVDKNKF